MAQYHFFMSDLDKTTLSANKAFPAHLYRAIGDTSVQKNFA